MAGMFFNIRRISFVTISICCLISLGEKKEENEVNNDVISLMDTSVFLLFSAFLTENKTLSVNTEHMKVFRISLDKLSEKKIMFNLFKAFTMCT